MKNAGDLSRVKITVNGVKAKKTKEKCDVMRSRSRENLKFGHFTLLFWRGLQKNVPNVKRMCRVLFWLINPIVLWRFRCRRCRRRRRGLSSLVARRLKPSRAIVVSNSFINSKYILKVSKIGLLWFDACSQQQLVVRPN